MQIKSCNVLWACICPLRNCPSSESDALLLLQDFTLHVLFDVMTDAWGDDPAADDDAEDAAPADALMDAVPSDDPYADAAGEAGSLHEAEVSPGAGLEDLLAELGETGSHGDSDEALLGEPNETGSHGASHEALLAGPNETGLLGASLEALSGGLNETGSLGASLEALSGGLNETGSHGASQALSGGLNETGSHGASHEALDSELESIEAKMQVLQSLGFALKCTCTLYEGSCCNRSCCSSSDQEPLGQATLQQCLKYPLYDCCVSKPRHTRMHIYPCKVVPSTRRMKTPCLLTSWICPT